MPERHPHYEIWVEQRDRFEPLATGDSSHAWYWQIRLKIVRFLISRYGNWPESYRGKSQPPSMPGTDMPRWQDTGDRTKSPDDIRRLLLNIRHEVAAARQFEVS